VMKADVQRYRESGCNDVLAKPVERERFYDVIAAQLAGGTARRKLIDDDAFEREMVSLTAEFSARLPGQIDAIRAALARADWNGLRALIHVLKGSAGSYGLGHLTELAAQIEGELATGRHDAAARLCEGLTAEAYAGDTTHTTALALETTPK
jgi:HPt (histidine-containing phosphotransfer) domain-containing protein